MRKASIGWGFDDLIESGKQYTDVENDWSFKVLVLNKMNKINISVSKFLDQAPQIRISVFALKMC